MPTMIFSTRTWVREAGDPWQTAIYSGERHATWRDAVRSCCGTRREPCWTWDGMQADPDAWSAYPPQRARAV
jgi:hypothetical protein